MSGTQISAGQKSRTPFSFNFLQGARDLLNEDRKDAINGRLLPPGSADYFKRAWEQSNGEEFYKSPTRKGVVTADLAMNAYWRKLPNMPDLPDGTEGAVGAHDPNDEFIEGTKGSIAKKMRGKKDVPKPLEDGYDGAIVNENRVVAVAPVAVGDGAPAAHREPGRSRAGSEAGGEAKEESGGESEGEGRAERPASVGGGAGSAARAKSALAKAPPSLATTVSDPKARTATASSVASSLLSVGGGGGGGAGLEPFSDAQLEGIVRKAERMAGGRAGRA